MAEGGPVVEAAVEDARGEPLGHRRVEPEELAEGALLVGGPQGGPLDDRVGVLPAEAALRQEGGKDAAVADLDAQIKELEANFDKALEKLDNLLRRSPTP